MINEATGKRWIQQMPLSPKEKKEATEYIKGKERGSIERYLYHLREKCGGRFYMNKKAKQFTTK